MDNLRIGQPGTWLAARAQTYGSSDGSTQIFQAATSNATAQQMQQEFINELRFQAAKSVRTSTVILASFNAVAAFATAVGILYDAYSTRKRNRRRYRSRYETTRYRDEHKATGPRGTAGKVWINILTHSSSRPSAPFIQSGELYPLVISCGIAIQGVGFAVAQAQGFQSLLSLGCTLVSQFMLPAVFIVPYIQLVFGVEFAIRGLRKKPFPERGRYNTTICLVVLGMLLLINFLVAEFDRSPDFCLASLFWFVAIYSRGSFAVLLAIDIILVLCTVIIFVRLTRNITIETSERVSASRMVYYLALGILSNSLIIPFFFSLGFQDQENGAALTFSMVASVVANVSGLMTGGLHLFLRSNAISTIGPRDKAGEYERRRMKNQIRYYGGSSELDFNGHMMGPVSNGADLRRMLSDASLISGTYESANKEEESGVLGNRSASPSYSITPSRPNPLRSNAFYSAGLSSASTAAASIRTPEPAQMSVATAVPMSAVSSSALSASSIRKMPFSPEPPKSLVLLPATTYTPGSVKMITAGSNGRFDVSSLKPPPSMNNLASGRHRRDSSMASSATVQIGLRLSNVEDFAPMESQVLDKKVYTLEFSSPDDAAAAAAAKATGVQQQAQQQPAVPTTSDVTDPQPLQTPPQLSPARRPSPLSNIRRVSSDDETSSVTLDASPRRDPVKDARMKTLPPVPRPNENAVKEDYSEDEDIFADGRASSPSLYSPQQSPTKATMTTKLPSPRGVGFATVPTRSNSTVVRSVTTTLRREASSASQPAATDKAAGDWI